MHALAGVARYMGGYVSVGEREEVLARRAKLSRREER